MIKVSKFVPSWILTSNGKANVVRLIHTEWKKLFGMTEVNAKYRFVQRIRSLPSYGVTWFTVMWKGSAIRKVQKMRLGITRSGNDI